MAEVVPIKVFGSSSIGVYIVANNSTAFVPPDVPEKIDDEVRSALGDVVVRATVAKSPLLGIFMVVNDNGVLVPGIALEEEIGVLRGLGLNVGVLHTKYTRSLDGHERLAGAVGGLLPYFGAHPARGLRNIPHSAAGPD